MKKLTYIFILSLILTILGLLYYINTTNRPGAARDSKTQETTTTIDTKTDPGLIMTTAIFDVLGLEIEYPSSWKMEKKGDFSFELSKVLTKPAASKTNYILVNYIPKNLNLPEAKFESFNRNRFDKLNQLKTGDIINLSDAKDMAPYFTYKREPDLKIGTYNSKVFINDKPWEFPTGTTQYKYLIEDDSGYVLVTAYLGKDTKDQFYIDMESLRRILNTLTITQPKLEIGTITGKLCYPSQFLPAGNILAKEVATQAVYQVVYPGSNNGGKSTYELKVLPGKYILSYEIQMENNILNGFHTDVCPTGMETTCKAENPRKHVIFTVAKGETVDQADLCDFYYNTTTKPEF